MRRDGFERDAQLAKVADDVETPDVLRGIQAISVRRAGRGEDALILVIAQRICVEMIELCQLADLEISGHKIPPVARL
jgi:hypothetical protein